MVPWCPTVNVTTARSKGRACSLTLGGIFSQNKRVSPCALAAPPVWSGAFLYGTSVGYLKIVPAMPQLLMLTAVGPFVLN